MGLEETGAQVRALAPTGRRSIGTVCGGLAVGLGLACCLAAPAEAGAAPRLSLSFPDVAINAPLSYSYAAKHVPAGDRVVLQRPIGTAKHYMTVAHLRPGHASGSLPAQSSLGRYGYRIAVLAPGASGGGRDRRGGSAAAGVVAEQVAYARVFGPESFADFDAFMDSDNSSYDGDNAGTDTFSGHTFSYYLVGTVQFQETADILSVSATGNTCRSVTVNWVPVYEDSEPQTGFSTQLAVVQENADPVNQTAADQQPTSFTAAITPGQSWGITGTLLNPPNRSSEVDINGTLDCY